MNNSNERRRKKKKRKMPLDMRARSRHKSLSCGIVQVLKYFNSKKVIAKFLNTGHQVVCDAKSIRSGCVRDPYNPRTAGIGFIGEGLYDSLSANGKPYRSWNCMINNCYGNHESTKKQGHHNGYTVVPEWHNFQNFAKWYEENYPNDGGKYTLCRKINKNKVYSPDTYFFATYSCAMTVKLSKGRVKVTTKRKGKGIVKKQKKTNKIKNSVTGEIVHINNMKEFSIKNNLDYITLTQLCRGTVSHHKEWRKVNKIDN